MNGDWQPIATAPRGVDILLFERFSEDHHWVGVDELDPETGECLGADANPTDWMALPELPA